MPQNANQTAPLPRNWQKNTQKRKKNGGDWPGIGNEWTAKGAKQKKEGKEPNKNKKTASQKKKKKSVKERNNKEIQIETQLELQGR